MKKQKRSPKSNQGKPTLPSLKKSDIAFEEIVSEAEPSKIDFPHTDLMKALYWIWDAFDRSAMGMVLVYGTALSCMKNTNMTGDRITVGVRKNEWLSGSTPILKAFTGEPIESGVNYVVFKNPFNTVPVYVYIYSEDESIVSPNEILYENEYFKVPNTYERFIKIFGENP